MHPAYTEEKAEAKRLAAEERSAEYICAALRGKYGLGWYEADTIARQAVLFRLQSL